MLVWVSEACCIKRCGVSAQVRALHKSQPIYHFKTNHAFFITEEKVLFLLAHYFKNSDKLLQAIIQLTNYI